MKYLKGPCGRCGGRLEFPADAIGTVVDCPHCGNPTELQLEAFPDDKTVIPRRGLIYALIAAIILCAGLAGAIAALKRAERMVARQREQAAAAAHASSTNTPTTESSIPDDPALAAAVEAGFQISRITLERTPGSSLVYAVGTVKNLTAKQRFAVKVELEVLDSTGTRLTPAKDYQQVIEPNGQWNFRALVTDSKAVVARLAAIREER